MEDSWERIKIKYLYYSQIFKLILNAGRNALWSTQWIYILTNSKTIYIELFFLKGLDIYSIQTHHTFLFIKKHISSKLSLTKEFTLWSMTSFQHFFFQLPCKGKIRAFHSELKYTKEILVLKNCNLMLSNPWPTA